MWDKQDERESLFSAEEELEMTCAMLSAALNKNWMPVFGDMAKDKLNNADRCFSRLGFIMRKYRGPQWV